MGKTSNYVVLMANLITNGKNEGIHAFIVQIRDEKTHEPMPGTGLVYAHIYVTSFQLIWFKWAIIC